MPFRCQLCVHNFKDQSDFINHHQKEHEIKTHFQCEIETHFECKECKEMFVKKTDFINHHLLHHQTHLIFSCDFCQYKAKSLSDVQAHVRSNHSETFIECQNCNIPVVNENDADSYEMQTMEHTTFKCEFCDFSSDLLIGLQHHIVDNHTTDPNDQAKTGNRRAEMENLVEQHESNK